MFLKTTFMAAAAITMIMTAGLPAHADESQKAQTVSEAPQKVSYSNKKLDAYTATAIKVSVIHQHMAEKIRNAHNKETQQKLYNEMRDKMAKEIEKADGITMDEYQEISRAVTQNKELAGIITVKLREQIAKGG